MDKHHAPVVTDILLYEQPYGLDIPESGPITRTFQLLGLGGPLESPAPAYGLIDYPKVEVAVAVEAYAPESAIPSYKRISRYAVHSLPTIAARAIFNALIPQIFGRTVDLPIYDLTNDCVDVIVDKYTLEVLCHYFYVKGDGTAAFFKVSYPD